MVGLAAGRVPPEPGSGPASAQALPSQAGLQLAAAGVRAQVA